MSIPTDDDRRRRARALFDAQVEALDGATATALRARRREALAAMATLRRPSWAWPASGIATAALALMLWLPRGDGLGTEGVDAAAPTSAAPAPIALEAGRVEEDVEGPGAAARFADGAIAELENDAEFYAWLATAPDDLDLGLDLDNTPNAPPVQGPQEGLTL